MRPSLRSVALVATFAVLLVAGVFREPIAAATKSAMEVLVTNDATRPIPVVDLGHGAPVQLTSFTSFDNGQRFSPTVTLFTVPAGKILVLDSLSGGSNMDPSDHLMDIQFNFTFNDFIPYVVAVHPDDEGIFTQTNARIFRGVLTTTAYAGPGTTVTAMGTRDGVALSSTALRVSFSGRLIDAP